MVTNVTMIELQFTSASGVENFDASSNLLKYEMPLVKIPVTIKRIFLMVVKFFIFSFLILLIRQIGCEWMKNGVLSLPSWLYLSRLHESCYIDK